MNYASTRFGIFSRSNACVLIAASAAWLSASQLHAETIAGGSDVEGNFTVGNTTAKGKLIVNAPQAVTSDLTVLGLQVSSAGGVFFGASSLGQNLSYVPSVNSGFYFCAFDTAIQLGNFFVGANGWASISSGYYSAASGSESIAIGYQNTASGYTSAAFGNQSAASGDTSAAFGYLTDATGAKSFSAGDYSLASGVSSFAAGTGVTANSLSSAVFGAFNKVPTASATAWVDADPLFTVGNGTADNQRSSALMVQKDGIVNLYPFGSTSASIVLNPKGTPSITVGGQSVLTANSTANFAFTGNLGVGNSGVTNAYPDADNVVVGSTTGSNGLTVIGATNGRSNIFFGDADHSHIGILSFNHSNNKLQIGGTGYEGANGMYLDSAGRVGIGTNSPTGKLEIVSGEYAGALRVLSGTSNTSTSIFVGRSSRDAEWAVSAGNNWYASGSVAGDSVFKTVGKKFIFDTNDGTGTPALTIAAQNGNVGMGTTAPGASLEVAKAASGAIGPGLKLRNTAGSANDQAVLDFSTGSSTTGTETRARIGLNVQTSGQGVLSFSTKGGLTTSFASTPDLTIVNGNVGIGATAPAAKLEVAGSLKATGTVQFAKQGDIPMGEFGLNGD